MVKVFAWPPVGVISSYWTQEIPVSRSRSLLNGREYVSSAKRKRLIAGVAVHGRRHYGSGYMEALWRYMDGGVHLVRLSSCRIPWGKVVAAEHRGGSQFDWQYINDFEWQRPPQDIIWFSGLSLTYEVVGNSPPRILVSGLPPNSVIALPGEYAGFYSLNPSINDKFQVMIMGVVRSNNAGNALVILEREVPVGMGLGLGVPETAVFRIDSKWGGHWRRNGHNDDYTLDFRQVFEDETDGFEEVNPWNLLGV